MDSHLTNCGPETTGNNSVCKIKPIGEIASIVSVLKAQGKRIIYCHGEFDLMHPAHIRHLTMARNEGDILVVTLSPDKYFEGGPGRPVFNQRLRAETLAALQCVDFVAVNEWPSIAECIRLLKPDVYVKSRDSVDSPGPIAEDVYDEEAALASVGGRIHYCEDFATSSTHLLNAYFDVFPPETSEYLQRFRQRFSANDVIGLLKSLANVRVLVVGDAILDEYFFCRPYGMASKSSIIAAQFLNEQIYLGGALAVANHVAGFCSNVHLVACLGEKESRKEFIEQHLKPNVSTRFLFRPDAPTLIKRRYVHSFLVTKLFEVSYFNDQPLAADLDAELCESLTKVIRDYDLVLVADFGHGFLSPKAIEIVCRMANYLAVNAQLNSINTGYNLITKYPRADYICIDEEEVRMACRDRYGPIEELVAKLSREMGTKLTTVTRSYRGSLTYHPDKGFVSVPVLSREVVDTMGAGDAYLSVTSPCACMGFPPEIIGFVGNAVGALAVRIIGNKESVEPPALFKFLDSLLR